MSILEDEIIQSWHTCKTIKCNVNMMMIWAKNYSNWYINTYVDHCVERVYFMIIGYAMKKTLYSSWLAFHGSYTFEIFSNATHPSWLDWYIHLHTVMMTNKNIKNELCISWIRLNCHMKEFKFILVKQSSFYEYDVYPKWIQPINWKLL